MAKKVPDPPNPAHTIAAQSAANKEAVTESAKLSAVDQYGPWGSTTFQRRPDGTPHSQRVNLSPGVQGTFDNQVDMAGILSGKAKDLAGQVPTGPMDLSHLGDRTMSLDGSGLPSIPGVEGGFGAERSRVEGAVYDRSMSLMRPEMETERNRLQQSLADRGIPLDSEAGRAELDRIDRSQGEAMDRLAMSAVMAGGDEQARLFGMASGARGQLFNEGLTGGQFENATRDAALSEAITLRNQPFNEAAALIQGSPAMQQPGFQGTPSWNMQPVDVAGITQNNYQNQVMASQANSPWNGLMQLGGAAAYGLGKRFMPF